MSGSYHGSPSAWTAYALAWQLPFGDVPDLLWLACVGVMDAYLHGRLDLAGYLALSVYLQWHIGRLFPNNAVDCAGRVVFAKELERNVYNYGDNGNNNTSGGRGNQVLTMIRLSKNGCILLLRHRLLWDSMQHSTFFASKLQVWKSAGCWRLMELLAQMGFSFNECHQPWVLVGPGMRSRLG